VNFFHANLL